MSVLRFFLLTSSLLFTLSGFSQINFFVSDSDDSLTNNFYKRNKHITVLALGNFPHNQIGASLFIHNSSERVSYYFEAKSNISGSYIITGTQKNGTGIEQKSIPYRTFGVNVGIARGFSRNWFVYGATGFVAHRSYFTNDAASQYNYTIPNHGMWYNIALGAMHVADNNISYQLGMDIYNRSISLGIGYTW